MSDTRITLLDCTLRDGSYQIDFGFSAEETHALVLALEGAGVDRIEVGHGLGLGAQRAGAPAAAETDERYMSAARLAARTSKVGVFAMTAFASLDDLSAAHAAGMDFLRFGVDAARIETAEPFVRHACAMGLETTLFLMKSYTLPAAALRAFAPRVESWGASGAAIVDSAGGMTPGEVRDHVLALTETTGLEVAFHGHNNLQLAVGNAFAAVEAGATVLDASLKGMGRSSGNAQIEVLAAALRRAGYAVAADPIALAGVADTFITRDAFDGGISTTDLVQGMGLVHSGMQARIDRAAAEFGVDPAQLTLTVGALGGGLDLDVEAVRAAAAGMAAEPGAATSQAG